MMPLRLPAFCLVAALFAMAQPPSGGVPAISAGHVHFNSADPDATMAFWRDVMGSSTNSGDVKGVSTMGASILLTAKAPTGPSAGSVIDHLSFKVPDLQTVIDRLAKTPYKWTRPQAASDRMMVDGPDGVRIELIEDSAMYTALEFNHIHFHSAKPKEMQAWFVGNLGGRGGMREDPDSIQIPGATLTFTVADSAVPSEGRAIDHVAFEVTGLAGLCNKLVQNGAKIEVAPHPSPELHASVAMLTDPWGTRIELIEKMAH